MAKGWIGKEVDERFLHDGLKLINVTVPLKASADAVWAVFADLHGSVFFPGFREEHSAPVPGRVGTVRTLSAFKGFLRFDEYYYIWDDAARRRAFYVTNYNRAPVVKTAVAEEHRVTPNSNGSVLHWTFVVERKPLLKFISFMVTPALSALLRRRFIRRFDGA
ncbi:Polyketide cyclase / dehydrase and lipid transport [Mycobacteroides abscessus subsp. massiliense]|uniref:SRPBCC family protein n=1 Tax=Mycobacteroides abscessus TaxID=36809 RepID=UPI0009A70888|nr:SRPBCC family protein [Mycobacteroides abscessus]SKH48296.1 Polyketide cyclase / dehydrase and lipid transport [Mycobacteroides abscessus subsp. massiliense]SKH82334.1 Polyketide cyclase / dehydrase and lipid transport [Mycobacteroides abscessus subsp. massiliense]SKK36357.1 Polyketide cyclase / dehydrase and lipid transport [Mycobacteroides abscessus subsp. massiliense]SKK43286.1 Polyketide cyclase / dehydrase and lipid transport [Mycobacteroides abscessus subsp. massiliense]SKL85165.1 Pol